MASGPGSAAPGDTFSAFRRVSSFFEQIWQTDETAGLPIGRRQYMQPPFLTRRSRRNQDDQTNAQRIVSGAKIIMKRNADPI